MRRFGAKVPFIALLGIASRFAALAAFTALSPASILADVLWAVAVVQVLSRVVDLGSPSLMRIVLVRPVGRRAAATPAIWAAYFGYCAIVSGILLFVVRLFFGKEGLGIPIGLMATHCACVALNSMVLAGQLAEERQAGICWNLLAPSAVPFVVIAMEVTGQLGLFANGAGLYAAFNAGDCLLTLVSLIFIYRRRGPPASLKRLLRALRLKGTPQFLALAWCSGLVKILNQKAERLLAFGFLSSEAYIVASYVLSVRDGISGVAGVSLYREFNAVLKDKTRPERESFVSTLMAPTQIVLLVTGLAALVLWWCLPWALSFFDAYRFDFDTASITLMLSGILPFIFVQVVGQISVAERSQNFNFFCQLVLLITMLSAQSLAAYVQVTPLAWLGPHITALVILGGIFFYGRPNVERYEANGAKLARPPVALSARTRRR